MDVGFTARNAATLSVITFAKPWAYRSITATPSVIATTKAISSLATLENLRNSRAPRGSISTPSAETGRPIGLVSMYRDRRQISTIAQHAARTATANVPRGGIRTAEEINMYKTTRIDPNNPRYRIPNWACIERMAPEFPAGIVYSIINPKRPHAMADGRLRPPGRT